MFGLDGAKSTFDSILLNPLKRLLSLHLFPSLCFESGSCRYNESKGACILSMVRTFLKVYMELGSYFLFLQEPIKDIIIIKTLHIASRGFESYAI
jgi:hypothetical protein